MTINRLMPSSPSNTLICMYLTMLLIHCTHQLLSMRAQLQVVFCCCHCGRNRGREGCYYTCCLRLQCVSTDPLHCQLRSASHISLCLIRNATACCTKQRLSQPIPFYLSPSVLVHLLTQCTYGNVQLATSCLDFICINNV